MALTGTIAENLEQFLAKGVRQLISTIRDCKNRNEDVLLVTVSRRMPHILFWFKSCRATPQEREILEQVDIVSEIALPFIKHYPRHTKVNVFVIDDVVVTGRTIQYVTKLTQDITGVQDYRVFVFFCDSHISGASEWENDNRIYVSHFYTGKENKKMIVDFISTIITRTLPIDVSYPLLYPDKNNDEVTLDVLKKLFDDSQGRDADHYASEVEYRMSLHTGEETSTEKRTRNRSYTFLLPSEISGSLNNDFAKIRTYVRLGENIAVPMAPNILSDSDLTNPELFENREYRNIWITALDSIDNDYLEKYDPLDPEARSKERVRNRTFRSLATFANYLYSLSSFNRITGQNDIEKHWRFSIRKEDLDLIVGTDLARTIIGPLQELLDKKLISPRSHRKFNIGTTFIPEIYTKDYILTKYICIFHDSPEENLMAIFRNAGKMTKECPPLLIEDLEYGVEGIMESMEALENVLFIRDYERKVMINRWIDRKIDEGMIVSRYAYVVGDNGNRYWRRFFRLTAMHY